MWVGGGITGMGEIPMLGVKEKGIAKVIRDIFRSGEQGFFYDPSDLKTQYQDAAGTTAINTTGQPLGLMLDKSKGLALEHILTNSNDFTLSSDKWTRGNNVQFSLNPTNGDARVVFNGRYSDGRNHFGYGQSRANLRERFEISFDAVHISGGDLVATLGYASKAVVSAASNGGVKQRYSFTLTNEAGGTNRAIIFSGNADTEAVWEISNVSTARVRGNHAMQYTSAARPILQQTPILSNELSPDPEFINASVWKRYGAESSLLISDGVVTGNNSTGALFVDGILTAGETYKASITVSSFTGTLNMPYDGVGTNIKNAPKQAGTYTRTFTAINNTFFPFYAFNFTGTIEHVSLKRVTGYLKDQNYIEYDGVDDKLITNLPAQLTNCTVLRAVPNLGTQVKYNQTLPMLYEDSANHAGLVAINRALTRSEQLRLMTELDKKVGATSLETLTFKAFDNNQEGFVYDPNDLSTMYQDSTGSTPVTGIGQPVGLILDKSKLTEQTVLKDVKFADGLGGFNISPQVEPTHTMKLVNGLLDIRLDTPTPVVALSLSNVGAVGDWVQITVDCAEYTSGSLKVDGLVAALVNKSGVNTGIFQIVSSTISIYRQSTPALMKLRGIKIVKLKGNHAFQTASSSRPILRKNAVTGANYLEFDGTDDFLQTSVALPFPATVVAPFDFKSGANTKCVLSAGTTGYLRSTETTASAHSISGSASIAKKKVDVLLHELTGDSVNIRSNADAIMLRDLEVASKNPYLPVPKYIGSFSDTHTTLRAAMDLYGMVVIRKLLTTSEEAEIRAHFNKRMGI